MSSNNYDEFFSPNEVSNSNNSDEFFSPNEVSNSNNNEGSNSNNSENFTYFIEEYEKELKRHATEEEKQRFREKYFS